MRLIIDGEEWHPDENLTRSGVLNAVREELAWKNRVILEMLSDGEALSEEDFLTVPEDIGVNITSASEYGVGLAVVEEMKDDLASLLYETEQDNFDGALMVSRLQWLNQAAALLFETYPEIEPLEGEFQSTTNWLLEVLGSLTPEGWSDAVRRDCAEGLERLAAQVGQYGDDLRAMDEWNDEEDDDHDQTFDDPVWSGDETPRWWNLRPAESEDGEGKL